MASLLIAPERARIFRIVHRDNVPWLLANGLHCSKSATLAPSYLNIGNTELIDKRTQRQVNIPPGGTLGDYVPFYFTPFSPMLYNIRTGRGITKRSNEEVIIVVSSIYTLIVNSLSFVFTDRHAYLQAAQFTSDPAKLVDWIDWSILQQRDFRRDDADKFERYQAEALVYRHLPISAVTAIVCYSELVASEVSSWIENLGLNVKLAIKPDWYFS